MAIPPTHVSPAISSSPLPQGSRKKGVRRLMKPLQSWCWLTLDYKLLMNLWIVKGLGYPQKASSCQFPIEYSPVTRAHLEMLLKEAGPDMTDCTDGSSSQGETVGPEIVTPSEETSPSWELRCLCSIYLHRIILRFWYCTSRCIYFFLLKRRPLLQVKAAVHRGKASL